MSTKFNGEGNIGTELDVNTISNGNDAPSIVARLSVHFDNVVKIGEQFEDRGGFWAPVEFWPRNMEEAERYKSILKKGMRIKVDGIIVSEKWTDKTTGEEKAQMKIRVRSNDIFLSLYRIESIVLQPSKKQNGQQEMEVSASVMTIQESCPESEAF